MANLESILDTTKKALGVNLDDVHFDNDITMHINSALFSLNQLGIGPPGGFVVTDKADKWIDYLGPRTDLEAAKSYVFITVRLLFDRPETSYGIQALERMRAEYGWHLELQGRQEVL